jgi:hypothetical protein
MFSAYDLQKASIVHTGRNSATRQECLEDVAEYLTEGWDKADTNVFYSDLETNIRCMEIEIFEHEEIIEPFKPTMGPGDHQ